MFLLAIDHRRSFERLFGIVEPVGDATAARLRAAKVLVVEALASIRSTRPDLGGIGVLVDDQYGTEATEVAKQLGVNAAVAFERSGQTVLEFEHGDWRSRLDELVTDDARLFAKVLVRHRADGDSAGNAVQIERLQQIATACTETGVPLLVEVLTPYRDDELAGDDVLELVLRPQLVVDSIADLQAADIWPDVWKVEGVADDEACSRIAAQARADGHDDTGVVVLGAGAPADIVTGWLRAAAAADYSGFAVGRSIWADSLVGVDAGTVDADAARAEIAVRYLRFVDAFNAPD